MPLLLPLSPHESLLAKLIKNRGVFTNLIHLNDDVVLMPEDWRNTSLPATTRKRDGLYKNSIPLWKHAQKATGGVHYHTSAPPTNKNKPWNITCWQSSGNSTKTNPKVSLLCSSTIRAAQLLPTVPQDTGSRGWQTELPGEGQQLCQSSPSHGEGSMCPQRAQSSKRTAEHLWWLSHRSCFPPLLTKALPEWPIFQLCWPHAGLQVSAHRLCCYQSQVVFFKQWHTRSRI